MKVIICTSKQCGFLPICLHLMMMWFDHFYMNNHQTLKWVKKNLVKNLGYFTLFIKLLVLIIQLYLS